MIYTHISIFQSASRSVESKAGLKRGASRISNTVPRALEGTNAAIAENIYGQTGFASVQVDVAEVV